MVQKKKSSTTKKVSSDTTVTRIKATDTKPAAIQQKPTETIAVKSETGEQKRKKISKPTAKGLAKPFTATGGYFAGAWQELKQVR